MNATSIIKRYADVEKDGSFFHSLRACGLAVELAHKLARDVGFGAMSSSDLFHIYLSGPHLRICDTNRWRKVAPSKSVTLQLLPVDAKLAFKVFTQQREFLADMGLNVWQVDPHITRRGITSPDLIVDAGPTFSLSAPGLISAELKIFSATGLEQKIETAKAQFVQNFEKLESIVDGIAAGLLLVSSMEQTGNTWKPLSLQAFLWDNDHWQGLSGPRGGGAHRHRMASKTPLMEVWDKMTWYEDTGGGDDIGMVAHFLKGLGLSKNNVKKAFPQRGPQKLALNHVHIRRGWDKCWVGTKAAFRQVYRYL